MVLAAPRLALRLTWQSWDWSTQCRDTDWVWYHGMIVQWGSTIKLSIELPLATRPYDWRKKHVKSGVKPEQPTNFNRDLNRCLHAFTCCSDVKATPLLTWNIRLCTHKMPPVQLSNLTEDLRRNDGHSRANYVSGCQSEVKSYCLEIHVHVVNVVKRTSVRGVQPYFKRRSLLPCSSTLCH